MKPLRTADGVVVSRLRKDARLWDVPVPQKEKRRGRNRQYATKRIHLKRRSVHPLGWHVGGGLGVGQGDGAKGASPRRADGEGANG